MEPKEIKRRLKAACSQVYESINWNPEQQGVAPLYEDSLRTSTQAQFNGQHEKVEHVIHWILTEACIEYQYNTWHGGGDKSRIFRKEYDEKRIDELVESYTRLVNAKLGN